MKIYNISIQEFALWHFTTAFLAIIITISLIIYNYNKERIYIQYALYNFFLLLFLVAKSGYLFNWYSSYSNTSLFCLNWIIQIIYHNIHIIFGIEYLSIPSYSIKLSKKIRAITFVEIAVSIAISLFEILKILPIHSTYFFFLYIHLPYYIIIATIVLSKTFYKTSIIKVLFFVGSILYAFFALLSMYFTIVRIDVFIIDTIMYFYIGIVLDVIFFSLGLGLRIKQVSDLKIKFERDSNVLQKEIQKKLEKENQLLIEQNEKEKLKSTLYALQNRLQKNHLKSHFFFNVMNSIKANVIEKNKDETIKFINLFSKFIRKTFETNFKDYQTVDEEINTISLYLQLEHRRMDGEFEFKINFNRTPKTENAIIPTLLLQPFVENSIWHGALKSKEKGTIEINIYLENNDIVISIKDNGPGFSIQKNNNHESKGIEITNDRIKFFNESQNNYNISYEIRNNEEQNGSIVFIYIHTITSSS